MAKATATLNGVRLRFPSVPTLLDCPTFVAVVICNYKTFDTKEQFLYVIIAISDSFLVVSSLVICLLLVFVEMKLVEGYDAAVDISREA